MHGFIKTFKNENAKNIDLKLINREYEESLLDFVLDVFKSLESVPYIKFLGYTVEYDESKIEFHKYISSRKKKKRDKNIRYHYTKPDRAFELNMQFKITVKDKTKTINKKILLYKLDKDNYATLKGNKYFLLYQLLDSSTYVTKNGLTMKSLMPIIINYRDKSKILEDIEGNKYEIITYYMLVLKRDISAMLFFLSKIGLSDTLRFFLLDRIMEFIPRNTSKDELKEDYIYFPINKNVMVGVRRHFWDNFSYVKTVTAMLCECFTSRTTMSDLDQKTHWLECLGSFYTATKHKRVDSGRNSLLRFERLLDLTTKKKLKVSAFNKESIFSIDKTVA